MSATFTDSENSDGFAFDNIKVSSATPTAIGLQRFAASSQAAGDNGFGRIMLLTALPTPLAGATVYWNRRQVHRRPQGSGSDWRFVA